MQVEIIFRESMTRKVVDAKSVYLKGGALLGVRLFNSETIVYYPLIHVHQLSVQHQNHAGSDAAIAEASR